MDEMENLDMDKIESRPDTPIIDRVAWLTRSVQGHLLAHSWCGQHWHQNGWLVDDDGLREMPIVDDADGTVRLRILGDATPAILRDIYAGRAPVWREGTRWPQRLLAEERARLAPPASRRKPERKQPRKQARRIRITPRPRRSVVPARAWRAASESVVGAWAACLARRGITPDKITMSRLERESYQLLKIIDRDPAAAWRQLVVDTGGDLDAGIAAGMGSRCSAPLAAPITKT
jgi:hypothetical protein